MSRRFMISVELLTGLSIGVAAAATAVAFMTAFLVNMDLRSESGHMATVTAFAMGSALEGSEPVEFLRDSGQPLVDSGSIESVVVVDPDGEVIAFSGDTRGEVPVPREWEGWYFSQPDSRGMRVGLRPANARISSLYGGLTAGLAALTAALTVLAFLTPRYLSRNVISPLREILVEADRFTSGGGTDPETAGASFHRLVELLHLRERQLNEMRERAEERAERVEKRSAAILSVLGSAVLAIDAGGELQLFNHQSRELFDLDYDDVGKEFPWERTEAGRRLKPLVASMESSSSSAEFQLRKDPGRPGRMYTVEISRSRTDEMAVLVTDVTRIGELERRIADQTAMADVGAASAGISHEMGNTLCALSGFVDLLARGHSDSRTSGILEEVRREVDSAQALISSFGSFARSPEPVTSFLDSDDLERICREACGSCPNRCTVVMEADDVRLRADTELLASCVRNIVRNALEAHPSSDVEVSVTSREGNAMISVADNGPGISMDLDEIFRPFRTTKDRDSGSMGLGLYVSRRIIRTMGGELSARNLTGGGAVFEVVLPLHSPKEA